MLSCDIATKWLHANNVIHDTVNYKLLLLVLVFYNRWIKFSERYSWLYYKSRLATDEKVCYTDAIISELKFVCIRSELCEY